MIEEEEKLDAKAELKVCTVRLHAFCSCPLFESDLKNALLIQGEMIMKCHYTTGVLELFNYQFPYELDCEKRTAAKILLQNLIV